MPKVQTQRMVLFLILTSFILTRLYCHKCEVRRTPTTIPPTTAIRLTYRRDRQEPDRPAPWLLRTPPRGTRHTPRRSTKSRSSEVGPAWAGDPAEQRSHRSRRRLKEEGQAERWGSRSHSIGTRSRRRACYRCSNDRINNGRGIGGCHVGSSHRCDSTGDTHVEQRWLTEPPGGIDVGRPVSYRHGGSCNACWLSATTGTDTEEEESCTRSGHWRWRRCGSWDWWRRYGQEARTAARGSPASRRGERVSLRRRE